MDVDAARRKRSMVMSGLREIAREVGLDPIVCTQCGRKIRTLNALNLLFRRVLERLKTGQTVNIHKFGAFKTRLHKARGLAKDSGDRWVVGFHLVPSAKRLLNKEGRHDRRES